MLDAIRQMANDYYGALPNNIPRTVVASAVFSFSVSVMFIKKPDGIIDINRALLASTIAATASFIHALVTPIFKSISGSWHTSWCLQLAQMTFVSAITSGVIHSVSVNNSTSFPFYSALSINWLHSLIDNTFQNTNNSEYLFFF